MPEDKAMYPNKELLRWKVRDAGLHIREGADGYALVREATGETIVAGSLLAIFDWAAEHIYLVPPTAPDHPDPKA